MPNPAARIALAALLLMPAAAGAELAKPAAPAAHPDATHPSATHPDAAHPDAAHPSSARPDAPRPDAAHPDAARRASTPIIRPRPPARHVAPAAKAPPAATPPVPDQPSTPGTGTNTGLPLPRFAALRSDEVNLRSGPGTRYPIEWVYKRRDLPVKIEREFEIWRLVQDQEGVKGWVHQATLAPRRTAAVLGAAGTEHALRRDAQDGASPVARLKPGVIVRLRSCEAKSDWCQAQAGDYRGWIRRTELWGVSPDEVIQ